MTNTIPQVGGGYQYPKAVLDAVGKRYLVEHIEADDGSWWYDLYSDGWVVQGGFVEGDGGISIQLPIPITKKLSPLAIPFQNGNLNRNTWISYSVEGSAETTTIKFFLNGYVGQTSADGYQWQVQGFAA